MASAVMKAQTLSELIRQRSEWLVFQLEDHLQVLGLRAHPMLWPSPTHYRHSSQSAGKNPMRRTIQPLLDPVKLQVPSYNKNNHQTLHQQYPKDRHWLQQLDKEQPLKVQAPTTPVGGRYVQMLVQEYIQKHKQENSTTRT